MRILTYQSESQIARACKLIQRYELHADKDFFMLYRWSKNPKSFDRVCIAWENSVPLGCSVLVSELSDKADIAVYVKPEYRRRGIGTKLAEKVGFNNDLRFTANHSNMKFWELLSLNR